MGVFERLGIKVLGTPIRTLEVSEDRDLFCKALERELSLPSFCPRPSSREPHVPSQLGKRES